MQINWGLVVQIASPVVAVLALIVTIIVARHNLRYRPHWARGIDHIAIVPHRLYNRTREDAESVVVSAIPRIGPNNPIVRDHLVEADGYIEYSYPENFDGYIKIEWVRSLSQQLYVQDIVEADSRTIRQRWQAARKAWSARQVRGRRAKERYSQ